MELFDKWYNCYYQVVRQILAEASDVPVTRGRMNELSMKYGFSESGLSIIPRLLDGQWPLLRKEGNRFTSALYQKEPLLPGALPLTSLQKSWLKALFADPRIRLFLSEDAFSAIEKWLHDTKPLFYPEDFYYFDRCKDGDDYLSPSYREYFQTVLTALKQQRALKVGYETRRNHRITFIVLPCQLQYSSKDDKFRLCGFQKAEKGQEWGRKIILNLGRFQSCSLLFPAKINPAHRFHLNHPAKEPVVIQISGERNSLERCMLHFANYEKHTYYDEEKNAWISSIYYDLADETGLLVEILSFGLVIRVLGPENFLAQVRERVQKQHDLFTAQIPSR